jgi:4-amino-4-deoxy-L-arabinose transferase-like glycosyltransferase
VLAKGPVILLHLLPVAVLAPWWRPGLNWKRWYGAILLAVLGGAAIALAWAIPAAISGGEKYRDAIFWGQTANRMVDSFAHRRPIWWYLPLLPVLLFPWLLWPGLWGRFVALRREGLDRGLRFCLAWMVPVFVSFSLISGKQIHYLVPLFPAFALFSGHLLSRGQKGGVWLPALATGLAGIAMIYFAQPAMAEKLGVAETLPWWPGAVLIAVTLVSLRTGKTAQWRLPALAVLGAALFALVQMYISANAWQSYDVRPMAKAIRQLQDRGVPVANLGTYHAQYQFAGRLKRPIEQLGQNELPAWLEKHPEGAVVVYVSRKREPAEFLFRQSYRGETAVLLSVAQARAQGNLFGRKARRALTLPDAGEE